MAGSFRVAFHYVDMMGKLVCPLRLLYPLKPYVWQGAPGKFEQSDLHDLITFFPKCR